MSDLRKAWTFFHTHAGYATPPGRAVCAMQLARAEAWAEEMGVTFEWEDDADVDVGNLCQCKSCVEYRTRYGIEVLNCLATLTHGDGSVETASLCSIERPSREYRRVVEAGLAAELQTTFFEAIANHILSL